MSATAPPAVERATAPVSALPPGPPLPMVAQAALWVLRPFPFMRWCRRRYGDIFSMRLPLDGDFVTVCDPAGIKAVFAADPDELHAGEANRILEPLLGQHSVLLLDGREHMRQRRLMLPSFHGERIQRYGVLITDITNREIDRWPVGQEMQLEPRMQAITLEVILRAVFGVDEGPQLTELRDRLRALIDMGGSPLRLIPSMRMSERSGRPRGRLARLLQAKTEVDALLYDEIARRRRRSDLSERDDILSLLIQARDENGEPMTDVELRDELMTLLAAGHETTATAMAWFFEQILRRPATLHRLEDELARGETIYLDAAIRETLRVRPVVPMVVRRLKAPMDLMGYHLPAEVIVACNIVATHSREDLYPNAGEFSPERFIGKGSETYTWIPFGGGVRRCLGASFATFEMRTVIPEILRRTRLRAVGRRPERIRRRAVTLYPARRTRVAVETLRPAA